MTYVYQVLLSSGLPLTSVVLVSNYCTIIVLVLVIMSVNNNSFS